MRESLIFMLLDNPNQQCFLLLNWVQSLVHQMDMQLHVSSHNSLHNPCPFSDEVGFFFVLFVSDNYSSVACQWSRLKQVASDTMLPMDNTNTGVVSVPAA